MIPFKSEGASVQSANGSRGLRISGSNAGYTMFRGSVKCTGYLFHQFPLHFPSRASPCAITFQLVSTRAAVLQIIATILLQEATLPAQYFASSPVYVFHHESSANAPEGHSLREGCWTC